MTMLMVFIGTSDLVGSYVEFDSRQMNKTKEIIKPISHDINSNLYGMQTEQLSKLTHHVLAYPFHNTLEQFWMPQIGVHPRTPFQRIHHRSVVTQRPISSIEPCSNHLVTSFRHPRLARCISYEFAMSDREIVWKVIKCEPPIYNTNQCPLFRILKQGFFK